MRYAAVALCLCLAGSGAAELPDKTEILCLSLDPAPSAEEATRAAAALNAVPGVKSVEIAGTEAVVTADKGSADADRLVRTLGEKGLKACAEPVETWTLSPEAPLCCAEDLEPAFPGTGVTGAVLEADGSLRVSAYVPHMTTEKLLALLAKAGVKASVQTESVRMRVYCKTDEQEQARGRLAAVPGVLKVEITERKASDFRVTREKGRATLEGLVQALSGTGWKLELLGN